MVIGINKKFNETQNNLAVIILNLRQNKCKMIKKILLLNTMLCLKSLKFNHIERKYKMILLYFIGQSKIHKRLKTYINNTYFISLY